MKSQTLHAWLVRSFAAALAWLVLAGCRTAAPWEARSLDGGTRVSVAARDGRACVSVAERRDGCFEGIALATVAFSAVGGHVAYSGLRDGRWTVVHDGVQVGRWEGVSAPLLSPDGTRLAYAALAAGAWRVVVDGAPGQPFDAVLAESLRFGPDGRRVVYAATRQGRAHVVVDDRASAAWDGVAQLTFDSTGEHLGYVARDAAGAHVVVDGWIGPGHAAVGELALGEARAPTASWGAPARCAYVVTDAEGVRVVVDGVAGLPFAAVRALSLAEPHGAGYVAGDGTREAVVLRGAVGSWHDRITAVAWGEDGRWAYVAEDADGARAVFDGEVASHATWVSDIALGQGGRRAHVQGEGERAVVVDESARHVFDVVLGGSLLYVGDGRAWACLAADRSRRELFLVVDGRRLERFDWAALERETRRGADASVVREWVAARAEAATRIAAPRGRS